MLKKRVINVFDAYFYLNGKLSLVQENLTSTELSSTAQNALIKNGRGNKTWASLDYDKEFNVTLNSNVVDFDQIALSAGTAIKEGATNVYSEPKVYNVGAAPTLPEPEEGEEEQDEVETFAVGQATITLAHAPVNANLVQIIDLATDKLLTYSTDYTVSGTTVSFVTLQNKSVKVMPYLYSKSESIKSIEIAADEFAVAGELVLKSVMVDENQKVTDFVEIVVPKAKPVSDFTISASADISNGNDNTLTLKALVDETGKLGYIKLIPPA